MKKTLLALAVLAATALALPAFAGGSCGSCGNCCSKSADGFTCTNECPLAQQANGHRSTGREGMCTSPACCASHAAAVARNFAKI